MAIVKPVTVSFSEEYRESRDDDDRAGHHIGKLCALRANRRPRDTLRASN